MAQASIRRYGERLSVKPIVAGPMGSVSWANHEPYGDQPVYLVTVYDNDVDKPDYELAMDRDAAERLLVDLASQLLQHREIDATVAKHLRERSAS